LWDWLDWKRDGKVISRISRWHNASCSWLPEGCHMDVLKNTTDAQAGEFPGFRLGISLVLPKVIISLDEIA
jgi:hypothetical protein